jgi:hypothetical protein
LAAEKNADKALIQNPGLVIVLSAEICVHLRLKKNFAPERGRPHEGRPITNQKFMAICR